MRKKIRFGRHNIPVNCSETCRISKLYFTPLT